MSDIRFFSNIFSNIWVKYFLGFNWFLCNSFLVNVLFLWFSYIINAASILTCNFFYGISSHVQKNCAIQDTAPQLKQAMKWQRGNIGLAPPLSTILYIFFKFQPPAQTKNFITPLCIRNEESITSMNTERSLLNVFGFRFILSL